MSRQSTDNLYIDLDYYYPEEYYTYEAVAESAQSSEFGIACDGELITSGAIIEATAIVNSDGTTSITVNKIANGLADFSLTFTQSATISHIYGSDLFAFSEAAIAIQVDRLRDTNTDASVAFALATSIERIQQGDSESDAVFSAIIDGLRSRDVTLDALAAFSFVAEGDLLGQIINADASFNSDFSVSALAGTLKDSTSEITTDVAVSVLAGIQFESTADLTDEFAVSSSSEVLFGLSSQLASETALAADFRLIRDAHLTGFNEITVSIAFTVIKSVAIDISSEASVSFEGSKKTDIEAFCDDLFQSSSVANRIRDVVPSLSSEFTAAIVGRKRIRGVASLANEFTVFADATRIKQLDSNNELATSLTAIISNIRGVDIVVSDFASLTAEAKATKRAVSTLTTSFTVASTAYNIKQASTIVRYVKDDYVAPTYVEEFSTVATTGSLTADGIIVIVTRAAADLNSNFAIVANNSTIRETESNNDISTTVSADGDVIADGIINSISLFAPSFTVQAVRNSFAILDSVASVDASAIKTAELFENLSAEVAVNATTEITAVASSDIASEFTQVSFVDITVSPILSLSTEVAVSVTADITREFAAPVDSSSQLTADNLRVRYADVTASSQFIVSAEVNNIMFQSINLVAQASLDFIGYRTRDNIITFTSIASNLSVVDVLSDNQINLLASTALSADTKLFKGVIVDAASESQCESTAVRIKSLESALASESSLTATVNIVSLASADISSTFTTSIVANKTGEIVLLVSNFATVYADADVIEQLATDLLTSIEVLATASKTVVTGSTLTVASQLTTAVGKIVPGSATLTANGGLLSIGKSIQIQEIVYVIPGEGWGYKIAGESGIHTILGESRLRSISGESRDRKITGESRIHTID